jgi:hypothetical protein
LQRNRASVDAMVAVEVTVLAPEFDCIDESYAFQVLAA